ncbi:MAG: twin-arginine translocation signal domain-containing protein, partial [Planctomycetota bacterium]
MHGNAARRQFLKTSGMGLGAAVLGSLFGRTAEASQHASSAFARSDNPLSTPGPGTRDGLHHPASAKR